MTKAEIKKAKKALQLKLEEQYTPAEIDTLEWFTDTETADSYSWRFTFPADGMTRTFTYIKSTRSVVIRRK